MGYVESPFVAFVPGLEGSKGPCDKFPDLPNDQKGSFHFNNLITSYYHSPARNQVGVVVGVSGLNSHMFMDPDEIKKLNRNGLSVIWIANPLPDDDNLNFLKDNTVLIREFLTNPNSPVFRLYGHDAQRFLFTHSTGSQITLSLMHERETRSKFKQHYSGAVHMAPYFDSAHASVAYPEWMQKKFAEFCADNHNKRSQETLYGSLYLKFFASGEHYTNSANENARIGPTMGQIAVAQAGGRRLQEIFDERVLNIFPNIFVIGSKDNFACPLAAIRTLLKAGGEMIVVKDKGHDPVEGNLKLCNYLIERAHKEINLTKEARSAFQIAPSQNIYAVKEPLPIDLGDRARLALQSSARLFNAGAGFAQGLLARGIGNAEVRGQAEGRALNGGNALSL